MSIRILLADDHQIVCDGLRLVIESQPEMEVAGVAGTGREAVKMALELNPDVVIMDISMPDLNGIEATRQIRHEAPKIKVIALSMHSDKRYVAGMLSAGATGYLLKECAGRELAHAIRTVKNNQVYLSPGVAGIVVEGYVAGASTEASTTSEPGLTPRETEVLQCLAEGRSTRQISSMLHVSVKTVETHRRKIMQKLNLAGIAELTKYAVRMGLTGLDD